MTRIFNARRYVLKVLVITLLIFLTVSAIPSAQTNSPENAIRDDIILIAERYTTHSWTATADNIRHGTNHIETPDMEWCIANLARTEGCWSIGLNIGVPYRWNGSTPIDDPDLGLYRLTEGMETGNGYFREKIAAGKAAGDISTTYDENGNQELSSTANTAGVDCVGFINNVWRLGTRAGTSATSGNTRAIRFENLKRGDILIRFTQDGKDHVVLFNEFIFDEPGIPKVKVYESSVGYKKVTESIWKIISLDDYLNGKTHKVKMERVQVKLNGIFVEGDHLILDSFIPRTLFQPKDIVLVVDRSGSMNQENRIEQAKESAKLFVDLMRPGDRIGVVAFDNTASQIYPPPGQPLTEGEIDIEGLLKNDAQDSIDSIIPRGGTSIGSGLLLGQQLLDTSDSENRTQLIILLSDGGENIAPYWNQIKDEITVPVSAMSIGSTAQVLQDIVMWTNGSWYGQTSGEWVNYLFQAISADTYREDIIEAAKSKVLSGSIVEQIVPVDSTIGSVTFSLAWPGSDLDLTLAQPDGSVIDPTVAETDPNIEFVSGATYEFYKIFAPQKGEWTLRIFGKSTSGPEEDYSIVASAADAMILSVSTDGDEFFTNSPIKITASIEDSILDSPLEPEYIHGVTVQVTANDPTNNEFSYELYDDGLHGDGGADDGVYANSFDNTNLEGSYNFNIQISGNNIRYNQPFTREYSLSTMVTERVFPSTPILDDFNRANGGIGSNWSGNTSKYSISSNQLLVTSNNSNSDIYFSGQAFGADQEVYVTFANVHATATEQDLILKSQSNTTWGGGMIEVWYDAPGHRVQVWTWEWPQGWVQHGADIPVTFVNGDTFGARALANGNVEVYKNGELLGTRDVTSWSYYAQGGYIGLWFVGANGARLDDFGGGTLPSGMQALMADAPASTSQTGMTAAQRNVKTNSASPFWQGIPMKTNQIASVTFANLQASVKPQSNGVWGENTVQVLYDVPNQRIQVWRYDPAKGWTQIGKDIPTKFTAGDVFTVRVLSGGMLEISHNGKLLAKRKASP
ncbi:MAG TPA: VWA domain-containing protein [Anaerolineales bacterium]|nr:VWA domain-containing protein [Anaerolineales bacterium]